MYVAIGRGKVSRGCYTCPRVLEFRDLIAMSVHPSPWRSPWVIAFLVVLVAMGLPLAFLAGRWQQTPQECNLLSASVMSTVSTPVWLILLSVVILGLIDVVVRWTLRSGVPGYRGTGVPGVARPQQEDLQHWEATPAEPNGESVARGNRSAVAVRIGKGQVDKATAQDLTAALAKISFKEGKHAGKTFDQVVREDLQYAAWLRAHASSATDQIFQIFLFFVDMRSRAS